MLLSSLGDHPVQIASRLEALGVRGMHENSLRCALAVFLHSVLAGEHGVSSVRVKDNAVVVRTGGHWPGGTRISLPGPLRRFVQTFDAQLHPALLGGPARTTRAVPAATDPKAQLPT